MLETDTLIQRYLEGSLTQAQAGQLHRLLEAQPELGEKLLQHLEMDAMLRAIQPQYVATTQLVALPNKRRFSSTSFAAMAACIALLVTWIVLLSPKATMQATSPPVAIFKQGLNLEWESPALTPGAPLSPGLLKWKSGIVQIEFSQGARVAIQGPAEFQLVSSNEANCELGKLSAQVPPQAVGFRINTPKGSIVDLGTEFGLAINSDSSEVHVFKGEVELRKDHKRVESLRKGEGMSFAAEPIPLTADPSKFAALSKINGLEDPSDPSLKIHFSFDEDPTTQALHNQGTLDENGRIEGTSRTTGNGQGKAALEIRSAGDHVRLGVPGEIKALTLAATVRIDDLNPRFNSLLMSDGWGNNKVHWQILNSGKIRFAVGMPKDKRIGLQFDTPTHFTSERLGKWIQLAVVFDPDAKEVRHYADGVLLTRLPMEGDARLEIGNAELGNWNKLKNTSEIGPIHLNGAMDEFKLWDRALTDTEVQALAE